MKRFALSFFCQAITISLFAQLSVKNLLCENLSDPVGLGAKQPRFSWQLVSDKRNTMQASYEIIVTLDKTPVWNSGKINYEQSIDVLYNFNSLMSGKKYKWQVRVRYNNGRESPWSEASFQM